MKKAGTFLAFVVMLCALVLPATGVLAATDGYYQLGEVTQPAWDSTSASRTKAPTADYDYTYGDESSVTYTLPWSFIIYGQPYTQITADTNGNIWFGATGSAHSYNLATTGRGPVIAAWNNDLSSYFAGGVFIQHKTNPERVVIEWQTETYTDEGGGRPNRFAVVLFPNGTIRTDYGAFNPFASKDFGSGISRGDGTASLSLTAAYGNAFSLAGRSFLFASGSKAYAGSLTENFGDVPAGTTSQPRTITLINGGTDNLLVSTATLTANSSGMFSLVAGGDGCSGATLAPSQSCTVQAVFSPSALGPQSAALSISSNDPTTPTLDVALTGTGLYPALTVTKGDTGAGTVTSSPAGISCGTACTGSFATGSIVTLTASPEAGSVFTGWAGACSGTGDCTVTMDTAKSVTASFTPTTPPTVTITSPTGIVAGKRPILQYGVSSGTAVVTVDGIVVSKVSGDALDTLAEGPHIIRIDVTNKAGYTAFAESTITVDTIAPTIASVTPAAGVQGVTINPAIVFTFSEALTTASVAKESIAVSSSFGQVPGTVSISADQKSVTFKPLVQLAYNRDYTVSFNGRVEDLAGNAATASSTSTFKTQAATADLVGLWHMDGDWSDASGNGNHGTANGGATFSSDRVSGTLSGSFDGIDDYINIPNSASLNSIIGTWEFWVKIPSASIGNGYIILSKTDSASSSNGISIYEYKGRIRFVAKSGGGSIVGSLDGGVIADNLYHHVAAVFSGGGSYAFYVDGISKGSGTMGTFTFSSQPLRFGRSVDTYWQPLKGLIDELAIYKRALTQEEVKAKYDARPTINIASSGQVIQFKPGETGSATVTVTHPVGVINLTCAVSGAATSTFSATFDSPQTQVIRDFTFQISPNVTANATANITCTSVDVANNVDNAVINLTVADITVPMVLGSSIVDDAANVSATKSITVNFSKALDPLTVNSSSVSLIVNDGTNQKVDVVITLSTDQKSITFSPTVALIGSTPYQFTVSTAVTDTNGNPLVEDFVLHFTTSPTVAFSISGKGSSSAPYVVIGGRYTEILLDNSYVVFDGPIRADIITLSNKSVLSHYVATTTATYKLEVTADVVSVDASSKIDVSGKGYLGGWRGGNSSNTGMTLGNTTTGGSAKYNGASYGGLGAIGYNGGTVNGIYGNMQLPAEVGSGGGGSSSSSPGGNGGGLVKISTAALFLNGTIVADGGNATTAGGGSGGGIYLNVGSLSGTGKIYARGGGTTGTSYGAGGGGRIAVYYDSSSLPVGDILASGGISGNGSIPARNGRPGTVYLSQNLVSVVVAKSGTGSGLVQTTPTGITCGTTCSSSFQKNSTITLTATPDSESVFTGWSGDCSGTGTCDLALDGGKTVTANFAKKLSLVISPASIPADFQGIVGLLISNVNPTLTDVSVMQFIDSNGNGRLDAGDKLIRSFMLQDGISSANSNVAGDEDGSLNDSIASSLNYFLTGDVYHAPGNYIFRISDGSTNTVEVPFSVTRVASGQSISGIVTDGTNPVPGTIVRLTDKWQRTMAYAIADTSGQYIIDVATEGDYFLAPMAYGYTTPAASANPVTLSVGQNIVNHQLTVTGTTYHVTGKVKDDMNGVGLSGIWVIAKGANYQSVAITGIAGQYDLTLPTGSYTITVSTDVAEPNPYTKGYVVLSNQAATIDVVADTSGHEIALKKGNVIVTGRVIDQSEQGIAGLAVQAAIVNEMGAQEAIASGVTNGDGNYTLSVYDADNWNISLDQSLAQRRGYVGTIINVSTYTGSPTGNNLTVYPISAWVAGTVTKSSGDLLAGVPVQLRNADSTHLITMKTGFDGTYRLGAYAGSWLIDALTEEKGLNPVQEQNVTLVDGATPVIDFIADGP